MELDSQVVGVPRGSVKVRYMRTEPERSEWHGSVHPDDMQVVQEWRQ